MERIIKTCFGDFRLKGDIATCCGDDDFYYTLPKKHWLMTDRQVQEFFEELRAFEE